jgi:type I restriction enzyme, S subunit
MTSRVKLGVLCHVVTKGTTPTSIGLPFTDDGVPFLRIQNLSNKSVKLENVLFVSEDTHKILARSIIKPKDFLITIAGTIGKVAIVPSDFPECNCNQAIAILRFDYEKLNPQYLLHWLGTSDASGQITGRKVTATISNLSLGQIKELEIPLPPLAEQQKIAAILDAADRLRQKDQQLVARYTTLSQSLFLEMFGDPVTNPMGWDIVEFGSIGKLDRGKSKHRPRNAPELLGGNHPLIQTGDIANCDGHIRKFNSTYSDVGLRQSKMWKAGTLCITIAANIAKTGILDFDACFPDSVVGFIPNEKSNNEYVQRWLSFLQKILEDSAPMAAQKNINLKILRELNIPLPPVNLQNQFAKSIKHIEAQKQQAQASLQKSEALFNSLLQQAFTGELTRAPMERAA